MKTEIIDISANGKGIDKALDITERTGAFAGLDKENSLRLRLLSEELIGFFRSFTDELDGTFYLTAADGAVEIHLATDINMDIKTRNEILSVASTGKNAAAKGIMGKIREMVANITLPDDPESRAKTDQAISLMQLGSQIGAHSGDYSWAMSSYLASVNNEKNAAPEDEDADGLEKSIVERFADDVTVHIVGSKVEVTVLKRFG